jgi:hypothetical protein
VRELPPGTPLRECEFRIHSQFGEDGILQHLTAHVPLQDRSFVEFGVEDFREANCRYLVETAPWRGLIMDGSPDLPQVMSLDHLYYLRSIKALSAFVTKENINDLLIQQGFAGDIGILSIDIDGNDYWIWDALTVASPRLVIIEYNSVFGCDRPVSIPYAADFDRRRAHFSWLYVGASIAALAELGSKKGYSLLGCNSAGNNAFFVRNDVMGSLRPQSAREAYVESTFRESRGSNGELTHLTGTDRLRAFGDMPLIDVVTGQRMKASTLLGNSS